MISLRKHIDSHCEQTPEDTSGIYGVALLQLLTTFEHAGGKAVPFLGDELKAKLGAIRQKHSLQALPDNPGVDPVKLTLSRAQQELDLWAGQASAHHEENEREIRQIIRMVAEATESLTQRDQKHTRDVVGITGRLRSVADISDLPAMRRSIIEGTQALQQCVEKMAAENRASLRQLTQEVKDYQAKLAASERIAQADALTGLASRLAFETELGVVVTANRPFSLVLIDLNEFKVVNDTYGHLAGDDLLRQFSNELRTQFRPGDLVGRWGGDEFVVIVPGEHREAQERVDRVRRWTLGEYKISNGKGVADPARVLVGATISLVEWNGAETEQALLARADDLLYRSKRSRTGNGAQTGRNSDNCVGRTERQCDRSRYL